MRERIAVALRDAVKTNDETLICTLRLISAAIQDRDAALGGTGDEGAATLSDAQVAEMLHTMIRQREASVRGYEESGRLDEAEQERREAEIIRNFLPRPLSESEVHGAVKEAIRETGASSLRDMGAVMTKLRRRYTGRMDFCKAGAEVRSVLT